MAAVATAGPRYAPEDPSLPKPWKGLVDGKTGYLYFWNPETNVTQYERPPTSLPLQKTPSVPISSSVQLKPSQGQHSNDNPVENKNRDNYEKFSSDDFKLNSESRDQPARSEAAVAPTAARPGTVSSNSGPTMAISSGYGVAARGPVTSDGGSGLSGEAYRRRHEITVTGNNVPLPFTSFEATGFPSEVLREELKTSDVDNFDWDSEDDREVAQLKMPEVVSIPVSFSSAVVPSFDHGEASSSGTKQFDKFTKMGFLERLVERALQQCGDEEDSNILDTLLTLSEIESSPEGQRFEQAPDTSSEEPQNEPNGLSSDYEENYSSGFSDLDNASDFEDVSIPVYPENDTHKALMQMGYTNQEASAALARCGPNTSILELTDIIFAAQMAKEEDGSYPIEVNPRKEQKKRRFEQETRKQKKEKRVLMEEDDMIRLPNPMVGFGVPSDPFDPVLRTLPAEVVGPPYFYYENVALAPTGVWTTISRFLYDVTPEFVDSKYFCAAARKRGYVHNLPLENRYPLLPLPPATIAEALPMTRKWWPSWDPRTKLNCLQTCVASAKLTERLRKLLECQIGEPPLHVQKQILYECRKWNLVWVGKNKLAPLECDEVEMLLGFPKNHTRGGGSSRTERYKSLGNSFQVDTVAYHLSVLKDMFPKGINVLSLFSGIGGAEVACHRLGIPLRNVVSVEKSEVNQGIMQSWWDQTNQRGQLVHLPDVQKVDDNMLAHFTTKFGGFDLVVGGSPCNNLAGSNRHHRDGLEGKESALFYHYFRILESVKSLTARRSRR